MKDNSDTPTLQTSSAPAGGTGSARASKPSPATSKGSPRKLKFFMDGAWHESKSSNYMPVTNSSTGELMAEAPRCTLEEVNACVDAAAAAFPAWRDTPVAKRVQVMFNYKALLEKHKDELATLLAMEMGKTLSALRSCSRSKRSPLPVKRLRRRKRISGRGRSSRDKLSITANGFKPSG